MALHLLYVASMHYVSAMLHFKPVYTPLALRDWFRAAPRNQLKPLTRLRLVQHRADREKISRPSRRYQGGRIGRQTQQNNSRYWVTEDEHRRLLERCDGKQLAALDAPDVHGRETRPRRQASLARRRCFVSLPA